jgi:hypothetical protein
MRTLAPLRKTTYEFTKRNALVEVEVKSERAAGVLLFSISSSS